MYVDSPAGVLTGTLSLALIGFLAGCIVLGGATRAGFAGDGLLQLAAIPLFVAGYGLAWQRRQESAIRFLLLFTAAMVTIPVVQLIPLPPAIWARLAGGEVVGSTFRLVDAADSWRPLSVAPHATGLALVGLLPGLAVLFCVTAATRELRWRCVVTLVAMGAGSALLGLVQVAAGNVGLMVFDAEAVEAVGFFANRNHFAAILYCALLFTIALTIATATNPAARRQPAGSRWGREAGSLVAMMLLVVLLIAALAMSQSRAGLGLAVLALLLVMPLVLRRHAGDGPAKNAVRLALAVSTVIVLQYALTGIIQRFVGDPLADGRVAFARNTMVAIEKFWLMGTGIGGFVPVYASGEPTRDLLIDRFVNHAHNEWLQIALECGAPGMALLALFILWLGGQAWRLWGQPAGYLADLLMPRVALLVITLLLAHSLVDYPLRTTAMQAVFAVCVALLLPHPAGGGDDEPHPSSAQRNPPMPSRIERRDATSPQTVPVTRRAPTGIDWPMDDATPPSRPVRPDHLASKPPAPAADAPAATPEWPQEWQPAPRPKSDNTGR